jgi:hypothetical protein
MAFGEMPRGLPVLLPSRSAGWSPEPPPRELPRWEPSVGAGSGGTSPNKRGCSSVGVMEGVALLPCRRGGGGKEEIDANFDCRSELQWGIFVAAGVLVLLWSLFSVALRWLHAVLLPTMIVERRLLHASMPTVLHLLGRHQDFNLQAGVPSWRLSRSSAAFHGCFIPSGHLPGDEADGRCWMPKSKIGGGRPDCNLTLWIRVQRGPCCIFCFP